MTAVLVTGAAGKVAGMLRPGLDGLSLRAVDTRPVTGWDGADVMLGDLGDPAFAAAVVEGMDAVVHLAANPSAGAAWPDLRGPNVDAVVTLLDAARAAGVAKVVLASSVHAMGGYPVDGLSRDGGPDAGSVSGASRAGAVATGGAGGGEVTGSATAAPAHGGDAGGTSHSTGTGGATNGPAHGGTGDPLGAATGPAHGSAGDPLGAATGPAHGSAPGPLGAATGPAHGGAGDPHGATDGSAQGGALGPLGAATGPAHGSAADPHGPATGPHGATGGPAHGGAADPHGAAADPHGAAAGTLIEPDWPVRPCCTYGATKAFAEAYARTVVDSGGPAVVCLRLGAVLPHPTDTGNLRAWLSPGDLQRLVRAALAAEVRYGCSFGVSANTHGVFSYANAMGYRPESDSAAYAADIPPGDGGMCRWRAEPLPPR